MRRIASLLLTLALVLGLCACGQNAAAAWQEQYDLGVKYLSEGNYEEAILAFTAAIEIDAKRPEGYLGLADVYEAQGDLESLRAILEQGCQATGDAQLKERLNALDASSGSPDTPPQIPEVLHHTLGDMSLDEDSYIPFHESAARAVAPLIAAGAAGNRDEALALVGAEDFWADLRQAMRENQLPVRFWTQWNGDLIHFEYFHGESETRYKVEYRPQEGTAFRCALYRNGDGDSVEFSSGSSKGWLINGSVTIWEQDWDGYICYQEGTVVDELMDGPYQCTEVTNSYGYTNYYQYSDGFMLPCWQGEDGKMYTTKRVHNDGKIVYWEDPFGGDRHYCGLFGPHFWPEK